MGSFKRNVNFTKVAMHKDREITSSWDMQEHFDRYLARKLEENDLASYWIINELYRYYISAFNNIKPTQIV